VEKQVFKWIGAECDQRVDLLGHAHGTNFGCERRANAPGDHEARHDRPKLTRDGERDNEGNGLFCTKIGEAGIRLQRQRCPGEQGGHAHDGQRIVADLDQHAADLLRVIRWANTLANNCACKQCQPTDSRHEQQKNMADRGQRIGANE